MEGEQHAVDLVGRVVLDGDAGRESLLAGSPDEENLQLGVAGELDDPGVQVGEQLDIEDVERRAAEGEGRGAAVPFHEQVPRAHRCAPSDRCGMRLTANAPAAARKSSNRPRWNG